MSTFDWNKHWELVSEPEGARRFAIKMADMISEFMQNKRIKLVADYGCGPAILLFTLVKRFPQTQFYGFDIAASILKRNIERVVQLQLVNLHFEQDSLPRPQKRRKYDLVTCFATLHYIKEIELAIKNLFEVVNSGGYLIFNYPNIYTRTVYQKDIKPEDAHMKRRFALVLAWENLLSLRKIQDILGVRPKRFYSSIRANIYVTIHKKRAKDRSEG
ncbi:MAG: trans-aconitate 2-methyltransferase [Candidatus Bathyarchaeia archaeon]